MSRKIIFIILGVVVILVLAYSFLWMKSGFVDYRPQTFLSLNGKTSLSVNFPLKTGISLYMEYDASIVPMGKLFDLEASSGNIVQVKSADELLKLTGQFNTREEALAFVKFFTTDPTRFLLSSPVSGIELSDPFAHMPSSLVGLLSHPKIDKIGEQWVIERDLIMYPNYTNQQKTQAQLIRSHETISQIGIYTFSISKVLAEGGEVNNLLPYYE